MLRGIVRSCGEMIIDDANANENVPAPPIQISVAPFASPWTGTRGLSLSIRF